MNITERKITSLDFDDESEITALCCLLAAILDHHRTPELENFLEKEMCFEKEDWQVIKKIHETLGKYIS